MSGNRPGRTNDAHTTMPANPTGRRPLYLILAAVAVATAVRYPQAGSPELHFSDEGDTILTNTPVERSQPDQPGGTAGRSTDLDAVAAALTANEVARERAATWSASSSSTRSTDLTSTTDDLFHTVSLPQGPERDTIFFRIGANLDARTGPPILRTSCFQRGSPCPQQESRAW